MQVPAEITFKNYEPSELVRAEIAKQTGKLEKFSNRLTSCRVILQAPQTRHRKGEPFKLNLEVAMPQHKDIIVTRSHGDVSEHEHVLVAIRDAFDAAGRQIEDAMRDLRDETKVHIEERHGHITKFLAGEDAGFIETADGREIYFHKNAVLEENFTHLRIGSEVRFVAETGTHGEQASTVPVIGKRHLV